MDFKNVLNELTKDPIKDNQNFKPGQIVTVEGQKYVVAWERGNAVNLIPINMNTDTNEYDLFCRGDEDIPLKSVPASELKDRFDEFSKTLTLGSMHWGKIKKG